MRALILGPAIMAQIADALDNARRNTIPWEVLQPFARTATESPGNLKLADRIPGVEVLVNRAEHLDIPHGYHVAVSFEEQPAGVMRHISISVEGGDLGAMPHPAAVDALLIAFGFDTMDKQTSVIWIEEFEPNHQAVNVVQMDKEIGHA